MFQYRMSHCVRGRLAACACLTLALALAGCGNTNEASKDDTPKMASIPAVEKQIEAGILEKLDASIDVKCPAKTDTKKGATFECTAKNDTTVAIPVMVTRVDNKGNVTWQIKAMNTNSTEAEIRDGAFKQRGSELAIECPDIVPLKAGSTFPCLGTAEDGSQYAAKVKMVDNKGSVTWEFDEES